MLPAYDEELSMGDRDTARPAQPALAMCPSDSLCCTDEGVLLSPLPLVRRPSIDEADDEEIGSICVNSGDGAAGPFAERLCIGGLIDKGAWVCGASGCMG